MAIDIKPYKKNSYLLRWIFDDQRFKINSVNPLYLFFSKVN